MLASSAEAIGTFLLVLVGTAVATAAVLGNNTAGPAYASLTVALSFRLILIVI
jgi:glycerol uptake facilitator-like aquaporin